MSVDISSDSASARALAEKKHAVEMEQAALETERARAARDRAKAMDAEREKTEHDVVEISKTGNAMLENTKKLNSERVRMLNENSQKHFDELATKTAGQIRELDAQSVKMINDHRQGTMERLAFVSQQAEDPFYRIKTLSPMLTNGEKEYEVKVALPEHEAQNLFVSSEGQTLKLALARRFQENAKGAEDGRLTRTNSYQSIVEQLALPGPIDSKGISRAYGDGVLTIKVPKAGLPKATPLNSAVDAYVSPTPPKKTPPA